MTNGTEKLELIRWLILLEDETVLDRVKMLRTASEDPERNLRRRGRAAERRPEDPGLQFIVRDELRAYARLKDHIVDWEH